MTNERIEEILDNFIVESKPNWWRENYVKAKEAFENNDTQLCLEILLGVICFLEYRGICKIDEIPSYISNGRRYDSDRDGNIFECAIIYYENERNTIINVHYCDNGNIISESTYINNKEEGMTILYNRDGSILGIYNYRDGKREGYSVSYYDSAELANDFCYVKGFTKV